MAHADLATDTWLVLGQWVEDDDRLRVQRTWLHGVRTGRPALVLQFAAGREPFARPIVPGTELDAVLAFWPGSVPLRALIRERIGPTKALAHRPPALGVEAFLEQAARALARQPWLDVFPAILGEVVPVPESSGAWRIVDGDRLDAAPRHRRALVPSYSVGRPAADARWASGDSGTLRPLAVADADRYVLIASAS